ncbi:related to UTP30-subunit of U3-containing 90S pre-ribosome [Sporisorium reilianum f. sp. reilianum]|uniref:Ribosomal L1 domain-containing protein 1 n=1 Tax=Sporisorium reilianum f. sp. reilianum TaxID=72559 RepID=A0A2N8UAD4_9BASI|nr:related to UTP30-subunit of U3-containing 90S pre-ribosome [Sporisorium reilianum f. sp. reilianum]
MPSKTKSKPTTAAVAEKPVVATPSSSQIGVANSNIYHAQLLKAFRALAAHTARRTTETNGTLPLDGPSGNLRDASNTVYLQITLNTLSPTSHVKPVRVNLPHALHTPGEVSVCLLVKDPQREYKDLLVERGVKCVARVVGVSKLKGKFKPFDARRALVADHDIFLADARIVPNLPNLCGKVFFDAKKNPITVNLAKKDKLQHELEAAIKATTFLQNKGSCTTIKVGYMAAHTPEQLADNVAAALPAVLSRIKGGWENVHNIDVKTGNSAALPVWNAKLGVKTHVTPSAKRVADDDDEEQETPSNKKAKSPVKKVQQEEETAKSPCPRKTRSAAAAKASLAIEQVATPTKGTPRKTASSVSRSARKLK